MSNLTRYYLNVENDNSKLEDDVLQELFDSDEDEDDLKGFDSNFPENMSWGWLCLDKNMASFTSTPGTCTTTNLPDSSYTVHSSLYFTEEMIKKTN